MPDIRDAVIAGSYYNVGGPLLRAGSGFIAGNALYYPAPVVGEIQRAYHRGDAIPFAAGNNTNAEPFTAVATGSRSNNISGICSPHNISAGF